MIASVTFALILSQSPAEAVRLRFEEIFKASTLPGLSACVILKDGTTLTMAAGFADEYKDEPLTSEHRFLAGSTGKTFFAALAMQLEKEGAFKLTDRLSEFLGKQTWYSRLPNATEVTLEQLMRHQSGIPEHLDNPAFAEALKKDPLKVWSPDALVEYSLDKPALFKAGEGWSYSDTNYILLAMAIEAKTGRKCYDMIKERFLSGLPSTEPSVKAAYPKFANGNHASALLIEQGWAMKNGKLKVNPQLEWAGGGYITNPRDLATWIRRLVSGDALDKATRERMQLAVPSRTGRNHEYAFGLMIRPSEVGKSYGHGGWYPGYVTDVQHFPDLGVTVCVMTNTDDFAAFKMNYQLLCVELAKAAKG